MAILFNKELVLSESYNQQYPWGVIEITRKDNDLFLKYQINEWSDTIMNDRSTYLEFHKIYKVTSGYWYGEYGYWLTNKRIEKQIKCTNISGLTEKNINTLDSVGFNKNEFSNSIKVEIESKITGQLSFECTEIDFTNHYNIGIYEHASKRFVLATHLFDSGSVFIAKL